MNSRFLSLNGSNERLTEEIDSLSSSDTEGYAQWESTTIDNIFQFN